VTVPQAQLYLYQVAKSLPENQRDEFYTAMNALIGHIGALERFAHKVLDSVKAAKEYLPPFSEVTS